MTVDELLRTRHGQTGFEVSHIGGHESRKDALDVDSQMSALDAQITAEFLDKSLQ